MTVLARMALIGVAGYQRFLSLFMGGACRFAPTCSEYARLAVIDHGALRGAWLATRRLLRCHPFHPGGYDPPPAATIRPN